MKRIFFLILLVLIPSFAQADLIHLKNGEIIEGRIVQVRGVFVRVLDNYDSPSKEFLMEDIVNIEQSTPGKVSQRTSRNIHQRILNKAGDGQIQAAVDKKISELPEEAIQWSDVATVDKTPEEIKPVLEEKAGGIIGEAAESAEPPKLDQVPGDVATVVEEKAGGVIERTAPTSATEAAGDPLSPKGPGIFLGLTVKDFFFAGLIALLVIMLCRERRKGGIIPQPAVANAKPASSPDRTDQNLKKAGEPAEGMRVTEENGPRQERRKHRRFEWNFPISLSLDENNPILAMVKNISRNGAYAICNDVNLLRALGEESRFKFNFASKDPNFPISGKAEIIRIRSNRGLGLKFFDMNQESLGYLDQLAASV